MILLANTHYFNLCTCGISFVRGLINTILPTVHLATKAHLRLIETTRNLLAKCIVWKNGTSDPLHCDSIRLDRLLMSRL